MPKSKETSLIRAKIDFTGEVDGGWRLDIRKKNAIPPIEVKKWIEPYLRAAREEAEELYDISRSVSGKTSGIWLKQRGKAESLDFSQPFLIIFMELCSKGVSKEVTEGFLDLIARCSPSNLKRARKELSENELLALHSAVGEIKKEERFQEEAVNILKLPPFNLYPYEVKQILKEIEK